MSGTTDDGIEPGRVFGWWGPIWDPGQDEQPFTFTPEHAAWVMQRNVDPFGEWADKGRGMGIGPKSKDWTFLMRIQHGLYSVLGALRATQDWRAVHADERKHVPAATELGRQNDRWRATRPER